MVKTKVVLIGASGHAKVIIDVFEQMGTCEILGLFDDNICNRTKVLEYPLLGDVKDVHPFLLADADVQVFIAIGDNWTRSFVRDQLIQKNPNIRWAQAIHPFSHIGKGTTLGAGVAILAGAVINSEVRLGDFSIVGSNSSVDHESQLGSYASLGPGCTIGGNVKIGNLSAIGLGANLIHGLTIGECTVIGAGATVLKDFGDKLVAYGSPARKIRSREESEKYL